MISSHLVASRFYFSAAKFHHKILPEQGHQRRVGWDNSAIFLALSVNISKSVADIGPKLPLVTNRKSHVSFPLTPRLMTLDDLELVQGQILSEFRLISRF